MRGCLRHPSLALLVALVTPSAAAAEEPARSDAEPPARPDAEPPVQPDAEPAVLGPGEVIVVTGLRLPMPRGNVPAAVTVIDRDQVRRSPHALADDLVRLSPAAGTFRRSSSAVADPTSQGLSLRGVGSSGVSRALVLRDGVPVNDPFGGWVYWREISPLTIDRIEVVPSGASALFGNFALGGVLQVLSRPIEARSIDAMIAGGSLGTLRLAARATERLGDLGIELFAEGLHTDGYSPIHPDQRGAVDGPAASRHGSAGVRVEHVRGDSKAHAAVRAFTQALDAGTRHTTADVRTATYQAGWEWAGDPGRLGLQLFGGWQRFEQERARVAPDRATATTASNQRTPSNNQGAVATWTGRTGGRHAISVGIDVQRVSGVATDALAPPVVEADTLVERAAGGQQRFAGVFVQDVVQVIPELELAAAVRLDGWQNLAASRTLTRGDGSAMTARLAGASELELDPRLGALAHVSREVAVRASAYRAFRAPTLNELYRPFQVGSVLTAANERLRPEILWGGELGMQITTSGVSELGLQATAFWNRLNNAIANVTLAEPLDGATRQRKNLGRARIFGLELDLSWRPGASWMVRVSHTFSDGRVTAAPEQPDLIGKRLAQAPRHRTIAAVTYEHERLATLMIQARYLDRQFEDDLNTRPIGAAVLIDARAERRLGRGFSMFVSGQNLFDRRYLIGRAGIDTEGAPRTFELGVTYQGGSP